MSARGVAIFVGVGLVVMGAATALDQWAVGALVDKSLAQEDWNRGLRVLGYVPTWLVVGAAMVVIDMRRVRDGLMRAGEDALGRGLGVVVGALAGGAAAEIMKLIVRRERPDAEHAGYVFRSFADGTFDSGGLGFPSSHTAVAFGAAWALCRMHPEGKVLWVLLGLGCGMTRVMAGAHWVSDVVGAALVAYAAVWGLSRVGLVARQGRREDALR